MPVTLSLHNRTASCRRLQEGSADGIAMDAGALHSFCGNRQAGSALLTTANQHLLNIRLATILGALSLADNTQHLRQHMRIPVYLIDIYWDQRTPS